MSATLVFLSLAWSLAAQGDAPRAEEPARPRSDASPRAGGIVAIVGDEVITRSELEAAFNRRKAAWQKEISATALEQQKARLLKVVLRDMISDRLLLQEARRVDRASGRAAISEREVDRLIEDRIKELKEEGFDVATPEDLYRLERQRYGVDRAELREEIRSEMLRRRYLSEVVFQKVDSWVRPQEMQYYYRTHLHEFSTPVRVKFRQILLPADRLAAPQLVKDVEEGLASGVSFEELAKRYSLDKGILWDKTAQDLEDWVAPVPEELKKLREGEVSKAIVSESGIHYLKLLERVDGEPQSYEEAQPEIAKRIRLERRQRTFERLMHELERKTRVENLLEPAPPQEVAREPTRGPPARGREATRGAAGAGATGGGGVE